jgi:hypothetical protein
LDTLEAFILVLIGIFVEVLIAVAVLFYKGIYPTISTLKSIWKMHKIIDEAGISAIIPCRDYYKKIRGKGSITEYISQTQYSLIITGISFATGLPIENLEREFKELIKQDVKIIISLVNPSYISCVDSVCLSMNKEKNILINDISNTLKELWKLRESLGDDERKKLIIKVHNSIPFASAILIDADVPNCLGTIQLETKSYKAPLRYSWAIELKEKKGGKNIMYNNMKESWLKLISDAEDFKPSNHLPQIEVPKNG